MNFSILVKTYNNLEYLKLFCKSIESNSNKKHQLIFHVNDGSDGSYDFIKDKYEFTYSKNNIGLCNSVSEMSKFINNKYVVYSHDDMFFVKIGIFMQKKLLKMKIIIFSICLEQMFQ